MIKKGTELVSSLSRLTVILSVSILKLFFKVIQLCKIVLLLFGPITSFWWKKLWEKKVNILEKYAKAMQVMCFCI